MPVFGNRPSQSTGNTLVTNYASGPIPPRVSTMFVRDRQFVSLTVTDWVGTTEDYTPQLVANPSFEVDVTGWESNSVFGSMTAATFAYSEEQHKHLDASLKVTWPTAVGGNVSSWVDTQVTTVVGTVYQFSAWVYVPSGNLPVRMMVAFITPGSNALSTVNDAWQRVECTVLAQSTNLFIGVECPGSIAGQVCYVDAVRVVPVGQAINAWPQVGPPLFTKPTTPITGTTLATVATAPAQILCVGDSVTEGFGTTHDSKRWIGLLRDRMRTKYAVSGVNAGQRDYINSWYFNGGAGYIDHPPTIAGGAFTFTGKGLGGRGVYLTTTGDSITFTETGTQVEVWYMRGPTQAMLDISIDGGAAVTVDTQDLDTPDYDYTAIWQSGTLSAGSHTVTVSYNATRGNGWRVAVYGARYGTAGDTVMGVHLFDGSRFGSSAQDHLQTNNHVELASQADLVIFTLGYNDAVQFTSAQFAIYITGLIDYYQTERPGVPILLVALMRPGVTREAGQIEPWANYVAALAGIVGTRPRVSFTDISRLTPRLDLANVWSTDGLHPNDAGHAVIADAIFAGIEGNIFNEWAGLTDSTTIVKTLGVIPTDTTGLTDTQVFDQAKATTDDTGLTDSVAVVQSRVASDDTVLTDTAAPGLVVSVTPTDTTGLVDTTVLARSLVSSDPENLTDATVTDRAMAQTDTTGLTDSQAFALGRAVTVTDDTVLTDSAATLVSKIVTVTDDTVLTDAPAFSIGRTMAVTDLEALTDAPTLAQAPATTDTTGLTDTTAISIGRALAVTDDTALTDAAANFISKVVTATDDTGSTDTTATLLGHSVTPTDDTALTDTPVLNQGRTVTDDTVLTDSTVVLLSKTVTATDDTALTGTQTFALSQAYTDTTGVTDTQVFDRATAATDTTGLTDTSTSSLQSAGAITQNDTTGLTDSATFTLSQAYVDTTGSTDTTALTRALTAADDTGATDTQTSTRSAAQTDVTGLVDTSTASQAHTYTDTTGLADAVLLSLSPTATDDTGLVDTTAYTRSWSMSDAVGLTDTSTVLFTPGTPTPTDPLGLTDTPTFTLTRATTDTMGLTDGTVVDGGPTILAAAPPGRTIRVDGASRRIGVTGSRRVTIAGSRHIYVPILPRRVTVTTSRRIGVH